MLALSVLMSAVLVLVLVTGTAQAEHRDGTISVIGTATVSVEPDLLVIRLGVDTKEETAVGALRVNTATMNAVIEAIKATGIPQDEISTDGFSIRPVVVWNDEAGREQLDGYEVRNTVLIYTAQTDTAAEIIDHGVEAGANKVNGVYFTLSDQKRTEMSDMMIASAILDARAKAEAALVPLEQTITGIKSISLQGAGGYLPEFNSVLDGGYRFGSMSAQSAPPILATDQEVATSAGVVFLIGPA